MLKEKRAETNGKTKPADGLAKGHLDVSELTRAGIFKRFWDVSFAQIEKNGLPDNVSIKKNYSIVRKYAKDLEANIANGVGMILAGGVGTLKTTLAVAVLREQLERGKYGLFVPMVSLIDNLYTMRERNREEWVRYEERLRNTQLLVLDDLGGENTGQGWVLSKVDSIITERYNKMLPVIVTTNFTQRELAGTYSERIMDRFRSTAQLLVFSGHSERVTVA